MNQIFNMENPFWTFDNKMADILVLEIFWVFTSIPLVTIGASSAAYWHCILRIVDGKEGHIYSEYFREFKRSFMTGTAVWFIHLAAGLFIVFDIWVCFQIKQNYAGFLLGSFCVMALFYLMISTYVYPLVGHHHFGVKKVIGNSVFLMLRHLPHSFSMVLISALAAAGAAYFGSFWVVMLLPLAASYLNGKLLMWIFSQYEEKEDEPDGEELSDIVDRIESIGREPEEKL